MRRTSKQNRALHLYFEQLAEALNDAGLDMKTTLELLGGCVNTPWTAEGVKELWRAYQIAMYDKESTADLETKELITVDTVFSKDLAENTGVYVEFPRWDQGYYDEQRN